MIVKFAKVTEMFIFLAFARASELDDLMAEVQDLKKEVNELLSQLKAQNPTATNRLANDEIKQPLMHHKPMVRTARQLSVMYRNGDKYGGNPWQDRKELYGVAKPLPLNSYGRWPGQMHYGSVKRPLLNGYPRDFFGPEKHPPTAVYYYVNEYDPDAESELLDENEIIIFPDPEPSPDPELPENGFWDWFRRKSQPEVTYQAQGVQEHVSRRSLDAYAVNEEEKPKRPICLFVQ